MVSESGESSQFEEMKQEGGRKFYRKEVEDAKNVFKGVVFASVKDFND